MLDVTVTLDTIALIDDYLVESTFDSDAISTSDSALASLFMGIVALDAVAATDTIATGYVLWANPSDSAAIAEQLALELTYDRSLTEAAPVTDTIHTWMHADGTLQVNFEGDGDLRAVLLKKNTAAPATVPIPPRTVSIPKPPKVIQTHPVVNPNPPRRNNT